MRTTTTTIENKLLGTKIIQTRTSNGTAVAVNVETKYDNSNVYQSPNSKDILTSLFKVQIPETYKSLITNN
jgi:hypothetical protein